MMPLRTYSIFLASSFELKPERIMLENFIARQNKRLIKKNIFLRLEIWEDMGPELNNSRKQDDYNKILRNVEFVVVLFWTKVGRYTLEEFRLAFQRFKETGKPLIYVYEKTSLPSKDPQEWEKKSKLEFINLLLTPGIEQFQCSFEHYGELLYHFQQTLFDLFDQRRLLVGNPFTQHSLKAPHLPSFVIGRESVLEIISNKLSSKNIVILISGEGGIGKTTVAAHYWHENKYTYSHSIYLFCAGGIINAMIDDGLGLELQGFNEGEKILKIQRKLNALGDEVLLVLDNANDKEDLKRFLNEFSGFKGSILITSRCREVLPNPDNEILLIHLDPKNAKDLFLKNYREVQPDFDELLNKLLVAIDYHTLVIEVFSKNLRRASVRGYSLKTFIQILEDKGILLERKLNTRIETDYAFYIHKQVATPNDILEVLYDFSNLNRFERYYLVNMAFLPIDTYSQQFLAEIFEPEDLDIFYESLDSLYQKGWIGGIYDSLRLSPVIQKLVLHRNQETLFEDVRDYLINLIVFLSFESNKENAHKKFKWIPFGRQLVKIFKEIPDRNFALCLNALAILLNRLGGRESLLEARSYMEMALAFNISNFGESSSYVASNRSNLALALKELGGETNLLKAKSHLEKALQWAISKHGESASTTAKERSNLANVLQALGGEKNLLEARFQLKKALDSDILNFREFEVARSRANLASILTDLGGEKNLLAARIHFEKAIDFNISNIGENAPSVATIRSGLARVLQSLGGKKNLLDAKDLLEKALSSDILNFGKDSPVTGKRLSSLGLVLRDLGEEKYFLEARPYLKDALDLAISNFGDKAPNAAMRRNDLALLLKDIGGKKNLLEAKELLENALSSDIVSYGESAPVTALRQSNLALVLGDLKDKRNLNEAKILLEKALTSDIKNFGDTAPSTTTKRSNLALILSDLGGEKNLLKAKYHLEVAISSDIKNFGEIHPNLIVRKYNLGSVLVDLGGVANLEQALLLFDNALAECRQLFSEDYYLVSKILDWIKYTRDLLRGRNEK